MATLGNLITGQDPQADAIKAQQQQLAQQQADQEAKIEAQKKREQDIANQNMIDAIRRRRSGASLFGNGGSNNNSSTLG